MLAGSSWRCAAGAAFKGHQKKFCVYFFFSPFLNCFTVKGTAGMIVDVVE